MTVAKGTTDPLTVELRELLHKVAELESRVAEHQQIEEALRGSKEKYSKAFNLTPDAVIISQIVDGIILEVNNAWECISGYSRAEVIGKSPLALGLIRASDRQRAVSLLEEQGFIREFEVEITRKSGDVCQAVLSAEKIDIYRTRCMITTVHDFTERKRIEDELRLEREHVQNILSTVPTIVLTLDTEGRILQFNKYLEEITGYSMEEVSGKNWFETFLPARDRRRIKELFSAAIGDTKTRGNVNAIVTKDGRERLIEWYDTILKDRNGNILGLLATGKDVTERMQAEKALSESEKRFKSIYDHTMDGIIITDLETETIYSCNESMCRMLGYSPEEIINRKIADFHPLETLQYVRERIEEQAKGQGSLVGDVPFQRKNGSVFFAEISSALISFAGRAYIAGICRDVTSRMKAETSLRESEEMFRLLFNSIDDMIFMVAITDDGKMGQILQANDTACRKLGYTRDELLRLSRETLTGTDSWRYIVTTVISGLMKAGSITFESVLVCKDNRIIMTEHNARFLKWKGHSVALSVARDVTARKQAEQAHAASEGKLAKIFESSPDGIVISRIADGTIIEVNGAWERLVGYSRKEALGISSIALNILSPPERQRLVSFFKKLGSLREYELDVRRKSGDTCPVSLSIDGIEIGGEQCLLMTVRDITERKLLQEEQQKAARLESLGTLAGGIAHDFNNLLTGIMGNISMAKRHVGTDEMVLERLEEAENASLRARNLSQQLLTFSRGGAPIKKLVTLRNVIEDSAEFTLRGSKSRCEFSLPGDLWPIEIDEGQIGQVIDNLVINADQSMPEGGIIKIRAQNTVLTERDGVPLPEGRYVRVEIVDSGIGISPKHLHKIFEPYFTTKNKGSGLGLATSYSIVKNHSGYITAQSVEGAGTTLTMYFPASENPAPNEEETTKEKELTGEGRILVMDDEAIIRRMISSMLSSAGYEVELTSDGAEAIERYSQALETGKPFLAVIMDLTVPGGMGGKEAIRKLLEIDPDVKAIVSSGYSNDPIMSEYKTYGFRAVITKPYRIGDLERALHGLSGGNR